MKYTVRHPNLFLFLFFCRFDILIIFKNKNWNLNLERHKKEIPIPSLRQRNYFLGSNINDIIYMNRKEYFEIPWASLRSMVEPSFAERSVIRHRDYLTNGHLITSTAIKVTDTEVLTADGRLVGYNYLVIATGHADRVPRTRTERLEQYEAGKIA